MKRLLLTAGLSLFSSFAVAQDLSKALNQVAIPQQTSANAVSNYIFLNAAKTAGSFGKQIVSLTVVTGASAGFAMLFDATVLPSNGAVTPVWCWPVGASSSVAAQWNSPIFVTNGLVAAFSTGANCDTLTASATAKFMGQAF